MASQSDIVNGIIIGAAAAAIGTIVAFKFLQSKPQGGSQPNQPNTDSYNASNMGLRVENPVTDDGVAPLAQNFPVTEAAYNQQPVRYEPAFNTNNSTDEAVLPQ